MQLLEELTRAKESGEKKFAVLIDPDRARIKNMERLAMLSQEAGVDYFLIGGSLLVNNVLDDCLSEIKKHCDIPLILFPGDSYQLSYRADALLFLSLISGRNAELLIGKHVITAPYLKLSPLEIISCGYMLVDGGVPTTVSYISNTQPIPSDKDDIAVCTAIAGEMLGLKSIYLDAGSGAITPVSAEMIAAVSGAVEVPIIVGGGISTPEKAALNVRAGADMIVVGNALERDPLLVKELAHAVHTATTMSSI
ncbi:MAG: geranylgeranylglyceryl/heptaprenylglyceryl phosphate synthase [Saprospiraceae bacterium]|nr:geranylgeranylglyceryl/heptaprenylglyceryl phosphate synthase [Saprospiraceae bacterium]